ncbi:spindle and kinetochore-associated protein 1-like [Galendromus occidentalis]|uniref:SKA complex subunit 1 n=1 Tax=Galendromus occidentalis TaxID=34638 RepID=A0AAJ6QYL5_9ACAR|nr:spindle and kinetochore-associated protein 1-like [Galendromus occidentalis]
MNQFAMASDRENGKPSAQKNVLSSYGDIGDLQRLTSEFAVITRLCQGVSREPPDENTAAELKNELLAAEAALQSLSHVTAEASSLKAELKEMMNYVKEVIPQNIETYLLNVAATLDTMSRIENADSARALPREVTHGQPTERGNNASAGGLGIQSRNIEEEQSEETRSLKACSNKETELTPVTLQEFRSVPAHIRGRLTMDKINETLHMLRDVMQLKYRLLKKRKGLTLLEKDALLRMKSEIVPAVKECRFVSEADVVFFKKKKLAKSNMDHLIVLRHLQKIRENRDMNVLRIVFK